MSGAGPSTVKGENVRYTAVARTSDRTPVAKYAAAARDFPEGTFDEKLDRLLRSGRVSEKSRLTITDKDVGSIHYDTDAEYLFLVICNREYPQRAAFKFLGELKQRFAREFGDEGLSVPPFGLSNPAKPMLKELCLEYNVVEDVDKITGVKSQVDEVKSVMQNNISSVLKNQENLNILLDKSDAMRNEASAFSRSATTVKRKFWWQNTMLMVVIGVLILILIVIIVVTATRGGRNTPTPNRSGVVAFD